ncbi:hypothetical protein HYR99_26695 [Candidatus Poribacteria bacterium]|nr:hypothetical protein [Candidatus Poribacteria bacterium]
MRFRFTHIVCFMLSALTLVSPLMAWGQGDEEPLFLFRGARPLGLGDAYEAIADDIYALHYNPAGLAQIDERIFQFLVIRGRATDDLFDEASTFSEFMNDTIEPLTKSNNPLTDERLSAERRALVDRVENILGKRLGLDLGLPSFGLAEPFTIGGYKASLALSLYTQSVTNVRIVEQGLPWADKVIGMLDNPVIYRVSLQGTLATALAVQIPINSPWFKTANVGAGLRFIRRGTFTDADNPFAIKDVLDPDRFKQDYFDLEEDEGFAKFARENLDSQTGYSFDLGTLLTPMDGLRVGLVWRNLASNIKTKNTNSAIETITVNRHFPRNFTTAVAAKPFELLGAKNPLLDVTVAASLDNPNGDDRLGEFELDTFTDHIHLGAEAIFWPKGWLSLGVRIGDNQGFATLGARLRLLKFLNLDVARYGNLEADWWVGSLEISF